MWYLLNYSDRHKAFQNRVKGPFVGKLKLSCYVIPSVPLVILHKKRPSLTGTDTFYMISGLFK